MLKIHKSFKNTALKSRNFRKPTCFFRMDMICFDCINRTNTHNTFYTQTIASLSKKKKWGETMLSLDLQSRQPIYEQLISKFSELVALGVMGSDDPLPSVRSLARDLGVNPNTVQKAYQELERRGIIYSVAGKGSFVASGNSANEVLHHQSLQRIQEALQDCRRSGLTRQEAHEAVEKVYGEGTQND